MALTAIGGLTFLVVCCSLAAFFVDGYYLPFKPCRPITYPEGRKTGQSFSYAATDTLDIVLSFYDQHLEVQPWPADTGLWRREELEDSRYLYSCYSVDINGLSTETGCIYVSRQDQGTWIEGMLLRSEGDNLPCPRK
jgi:hypothetical protein